jgi:hypothetical protein
MTAALQLSQCPTAKGWDTGTAAQSSGTPSGTDTGTPSARPASALALALSHLSRTSGQHAVDTCPTPITNICSSGTPIRAQLYAIARAEFIDARLIDRITPADLAECDGCSLDTLRAYVRALHATEQRERGRKPEAETAVVFCRSCGPVWLSPEVARVAPAVDGWPRVLGCPWCHVRNRKAIPRPPVNCDGCIHFSRDSVNPAGGMGRCQLGLAGRTLPFPHAERECADWRPAASNIIPRSSNHVVVQ